jgi:hypothetical protein
MTTQRVELRHDAASPPRRGSVNGSINGNGNGNGNGNQSRACGSL